MQGKIRLGNGEQTRVSNVSHCKQKQTSAYNMNFKLRKSQRLIPMRENKRSIMLQTTNDGKNLLTFHVSWQTFDCQSVSKTPVSTFICKMCRLHLIILLCCFVVWLFRCFVAWCSEGKPPYESHCANGFYRWKQLNNKTTKQPNHKKAIIPKRLLPPCQSP